MKYVHNRSTEEVTNTNQTPTHHPHSPASGSVSPGGIREDVPLENSERTTAQRSAAEDRQIVRLIRLSMEAGIDEVTIVKGPMPPKKRVTLYLDKLTQDTADSNQA